MPWSPGLLRASVGWQGGGQPGALGDTGHRSAQHSWPSAFRCAEAALTVRPLTPHPRVCLGNVVTKHLLNIYLMHLCYLTL